MKTKGSTKILGGLYLTSIGWTTEGTTYGKVQSLIKGDVANIDKLGNNESSGVTNVLVVVVGPPIADLWDADFLLINVENEMTQPL